jgi:hypothetical protein
MLENVIQLVGSGRPILLNLGPLGRLMYGVAVRALKARPDHYSPSSNVALEAT